MNDLSTIAEKFKLAVKLLALALISFFFLWILWIFLVFLFKILFPPEGKVADNSFGKLPNPFLSYDNSLKTINFSEEIPGDLSTNTRLIEVYSIPILKAELSSLDNAKKRAKSAGLDSEPVKISESEWRWTNLKNPNKTLDINIVTNNLNFSYNYISDPTALQGSFQTSDEQIISIAKNYLKKFGSLPDELENGETKIVHLSLEAGQQKVVGSYSESNAVQVAFFRDKINNLKVVETNKDEPMVRVVLSPSSNTDKQLLNLDFTFWKVDLKKSAIYKTISQKQAFTKLQNGEGWIAETDPEIREVTITNIYLAYFNPPTYSRFLQPVYVFEGFGNVEGEKKNFTGYVAAIAS
jgi:hypothetical protein